MVETKEAAEFNLTSAQALGYYAFMLVRAQVAALPKGEHDRLEPALKAVAQAIGFDQQLVYSQQGLIIEAAYAEIGRRLRKKTEDIPVMVCSDTNWSKTGIKPRRRTRTSSNNGFPY
jgi:hypothetical protein